MKGIMAEIEHEVRPPETRLAYGPVLTKAHARKLGVFGATQSVLGGSEVGEEESPLRFFTSYEVRPPEETEETGESSLAAIYNRLLDIFCSLFMKEE